jgi:phosphoribosylformylglycinamidine synthase subunit PurL
MIHSDLVDSAHDCSEGGIAVALAECGFAYGVGAGVDLNSEGLAREFVLFGEDAGRIVISSNHANLPQIQAVAKRNGISAERLGETVPEQLEIRVDGSVAVSSSVGALGDCYENGLPVALSTEPETQRAEQG